jgi:carbamate kinase
VSRIVVAVGGNALVSPEHESMIDQFGAVAALAPQLVDLVADGRDVVITHGNGPQVGYILRRSELAIGEVAPIPIDFAVGDTQGAIGHMFLLAFRNELERRSLGHNVAALVTQVVVDAHDPAFANPTKPIGSFFDEPRARSLADQFGWTFAEDSGRGWRRVVASPEPINVVETPVIETLLRAGTVVVAAGGGGVPVTADTDGMLHRAEAVVDKDLTSALLAADIDATVLVFLTGIDRIAVGFGTPQQRWLDNVTVGEAAAMLGAGEFGSGSMAPKIDAAVRFLRGARGDGSRFVLITSPARLSDALKGSAGTRIQ